MEMTFDRHSHICTGRCEALTKTITNMLEPLVGGHKFCHALSSRNG